MRATVLISILLVQFSCFGQAVSQIGIDCNPRLNPGEIEFLKRIFVADTFNFENKNIGFAINKGFRIGGFNNSFLPVSKKEYFKVLVNDADQRLRTKLIVLDSLQKLVTGGFDAIAVVFDKKYQSKADRSDFKRLITVFGYRELNYPDNLGLAGNDSSTALSAADAHFFNQIFKTPRGVFDFNKKKITIVNTQARSIVSKKQFIDGVKKHLEEDFLYPYDFLYLFSEEEKKETGGYDAAIICSCLKCSGRDAVAIIKENNN